MDRFSELSVISGPMPIVVSVLGVLGGLWLLAGRPRWFTRTAIPVCATAAIVVTVVLYLAVEKVWRPFPDPIEVPIYVWIGLAIFALGLLVPRIRAGRGLLSGVVSVLAAALVVLTAASQINLVFAAYPTLADVLGRGNLNRISFTEVPGPTTPVVTGVPLDSVWQAPENLPAMGAVTSAPIPGTASGFKARDAEIYLPPAYFTNPRPLLPVLVLLPGQPGSPQDWLEGGRLTAIMDAFAGDHQGLAPVVVVPDSTGSQLANPLCLDSRLGNVATYLAKDVPNWIRTHLQVNPDPKAWAVGGLSYGGTCSLQLATNYPEVYPTFLDLSGQEEPTLGDLHRTIDAAFGGDESAYKKVNPLDLMQSRKYPGSAGVFVIGRDDHAYQGGEQKVYQAAKDAGMDVQYVEVPGSHSFAVWSAGLRTEADWLARRLGLIG